MFEEKMKIAVIRSLKLIIVIVVLTWINNYYWLFHLNTKNHFYNNPVLFPMIISILAVGLIMITFIHNQNITREFNKIMEASRNSASANLSKSRFLDNIGHELRTPMVGILGSSDLLEQSMLNAEQRLHMDTIKACGEKLLSIIDYILDMSGINPPANQSRSKSVNWDQFTGINSSDINRQLNGYLYNQFQFLPINILLVEDNELNQKLIIQMLISYGFEVETVNNGLECLQILQEKDFNLILMDMQMPVLDGFETTRKIRSNSCWNHIPIIAITANTLSYDREKCLACGCNSYFPKPFTSSELATEIKASLKTDFVRKSCVQNSNELITQLIPEFIEILAEMLEELHEAVENQDMQNIQSLSHAIKGTAGMYGFLQISEIAALIEQAERDKLYSRIPQLFSQLEKSYQQIITRQNANIVG